MVADRLIFGNINNIMAGKTTLLVLLLLALALPGRTDTSGEGGGTATSRARDRWPVLGLGARTAVAVADDPAGGSPEFFTPKAQAAGALDVLLDVPLLSALSLGIGLQLHGTTISNYAGGWVYKSHWGAGMRISLGRGWLVSSPANPMRLKLGGSAGTSFNFDLYSLTTLIFFYPGIFLEPYLELDNRKRERSSLALVLPIDYFFRRDLGFYGSIGIGALWRYTLE